MTENIKEKYQQLVNILKGYVSVAIAFSGGVDSTLLLYAAREALGENVLAVTISSETLPSGELDEAKKFCLERGIKHLTVESHELEIPGFSENPPDRCYICKRALFGNLKELAAGRGLACVCEGSNMDDMGDFRPGMKAIAELDIKSPLMEAGLYKKEIRALSREFGLPTWNKPSAACLASRFPYGEPITEEKLDMVDRAEHLLAGLGFTQIRVRIHGGSIARIEIPLDEFEKILSPETCAEINSKLRSYGFAYVTLDLGGYRSGSLNEVLPG